MKDIINKIKKESIEGDILKFGTWQGLCLLILNKLFGDVDRKFIGIDSILVKKILNTYCNLL